MNNIKKQASRQPRKKESKPRRKKGTIYKDQTNTQLAKTPRQWLEIRANESRRGQIHYSKLSYYIWFKYLAETQDQPEPPWPLMTDTTIKVNGIDRPVVKVTFTPEAIKYAHRLAELVNESAKIAYERGEIGGQWSDTTEEERFRGMLGQIACLTLKHEQDGWSSLYEEIEFGKKDHGDLSFKTVKVDAKSTYSDGRYEDRLNVNRKQFMKNKHKYKAYVSVVVPSNKNDTIDKLLTNCNTVYILGYADPKKIAKAFKDYKAGRPITSGYEVRPGRNKVTGKFDDYDNLYCQIKASKLESVNNLIKVMTKDYGKPYLSEARERLKRR